MPDPLPSDRISADPPGQHLEASVRRFVGPHSAYYLRAFHRIQSSAGIGWTLNWAAAGFGPLWAAARNLWGFFWVFLILELIALVQIGRGLWGDLGAEQAARAERLIARAQETLRAADEAEAAGRANADALRTVAENMTSAAEMARLDAEAAAAGAPVALLIGIALLLALRTIAGVYANIAYEKRYSKWCIDPSIGHGVSHRSLAVGTALILAIVPLTLYRFTAGDPHAAIVAVPVDRDLYTEVAVWLDVDVFDHLATRWAGAFAGITLAIRTLLDGVEAMLVATPWMVTITIILAIAWRMAGSRTAIFTAAGLAYLALFGFWENSMITVALLGTAALICIVMGIPLGILCGKNDRFYTVVRPILDFMQTMPSFVYLIPVIAFFGTGKPAGIVATIIFGMPPVVRLTALGIRGVPQHIKEAAVAFGCSRRKLLTDVEIPLATPSIMAGVNQTILMCLAMVVIASLIGAEGLGHEVLVALQFAAKGEGLLAGLAILVCAMIIDRIVQGRFKRADQSAR